LATVERLAGLGAAVALNHLPGDARGAQQVERLAGLGLRVIAAPGDVSDGEPAAAMIAEAVERLGRLDFLVNNAGTPATPTPIPMSDLDRVDEAFWNRILATNLVGPFRCTRAAAAALRAAGGAVVNTASVGGLDLPGSSIAYSASKAGLINLTKNLARALAPEVRVNAVAPGLVASDWTSTWPEERVRGAVERSLLKRACSPQDIAEVIVFLCAGATMITGQTLVVDGGLSLG
jgi:3-oxoacyl-[acyl-carrier protein] reductase